MQQEAATAQFPVGEPCRKNPHKISAKPVMSNLKQLNGNSGTDTFNVDLELSTALSTL